MQGKKEQHLDKNTREERLAKVNKTRSSTLKLVSLTGTLYTLLASSRKLNMAGDSEKADHLKGMIKALPEINKEEDISEIDTQVEQLSLE